MDPPFSQPPLITDERSEPGRRSARRNKKVLLKLRETCLCAKSLEKVMQSPKTDPKHLSWVLKTWMTGERSVCGKFIMLDVEYKHGGGVDFGREYASYPSMQNCPGYIRRLCSVDNYKDIDIMNAFPTILLQIVGHLREQEQLDVPTPILQKYVGYREEWIKSICVDLAVSRKQVKNAVLIIMHGGNYKQAVEEKLHPMLDAFVTEMRTLVKKLCKIEQYKDMWSQAVEKSSKKVANTEEKKRKGGKVKKGSDCMNPEGTFMSWLCQDKEATIIRAAKAYFEEQGFSVECLVFDGMMVRCEGQVDERHLRGAEQRAFEVTNIRVTFDEKSLDPKPEDVAKVGDEPLRPLPDVNTSLAEQLQRLDPKQKLILFDFNGTLGGSGKSKKLRPGLESLKQLQEAGYAIGIWSNAQRSRIPLLEIACKHGLHFSVVLTGNECVDPTADYRAKHRQDLGQFDKLKPVGERFPAPEGWRVIIVDDTPAKIKHEDRHLLRPIKTWAEGDGAEEDAELPKMVQKLLAEDHDVEAADPSMELKQEPFRYFKDAKDIPLEKMLLRNPFNPEEGKAMFPIKFKKGIKVMCINAAMAMGKSHTFKQHLELDKAFKEDPTRRVLIVTNRKQQARTHMANLEVFGFKHYQDLGSVTYESLGHLRDDDKRQVKKFWMIVIDEIHAVLEEMLSTATNGKQLTDRANLFRATCRSAERVLLLDADLEADGMVHTFVNEISKPEEQCILRYTHIPLQRKLAMVNAETLYALAHNDIVDGHKLFMVFRSKADLHAWLKTELEKGVFPYLVIDGDTTDKDLAKLFENIDATLRDVQVVLITSKVTTGADINVPFYRIYAFCDTFGGPTPLDVHQMLGRPRKVTSNEVIISLPSARNNTGAWAKDPDARAVWEYGQFRVLQTAKRDYAKQVVRGYDNSEELEVKDDDVVDKYIRWTEPWLMKLYTISCAGQKGCFTTSVVRHAVHKGYTLMDASRTSELVESVSNDVEAAKKAVKESKKKNKEEAEKIDANLLVELQQKSLDDISEHTRYLLDDVARGSWTSDQQTTYNMYVVFKIFPEHYSTLTFKQVQWVSNNMEVLKAAGWIQKLRDDVSAASKACQSQDLHKLIHAGLVEKRPVLYPVLVHTQKLLLKLGFPMGIASRTTVVDDKEVRDEIEGKNIEAKKQLVIEACNEIVNFIRGKRASRGGKAISILRLDALSIIGLTLVRRSAGKKKNKRAMYRVEPHEMVAELLLKAEFNYEAKPMPWERERPSDIVEYFYATFGMTVVPSGEYNSSGNQSYRVIHVSDSDASAAPAQEPSALEATSGWISNKRMKITHVPSKQDVHKFGSGHSEIQWFRLIKLQAQYAMCAGLGYAGPGSWND